MRVLLVIVFGVAILASGIWMEYQGFLSEPIELGRDTLVIEVERGASLRELGENLTELGIVDHPYFFLAMAYINDSATRLKAGEFEIPNGITPPKLLELLTSGKVVQHAFTLVEGWTYQDALAALAEDDRFESLLGENPSAGLVMASLGYPGEHPEGRFFPETYHFAKGASDLDILRRSYSTMEHVLDEEWGKRDDGLPLATPYEALILASIVEKETGVASERPTIAGVFVRRLLLGMKLQTDPTVIYGLGESFDGNLTQAHLRGDTPYNTYVHAGLPPTPIALPGRQAIHAVLHPEEGDSLYFVAKGDGSHHFSATLEEHNRAVRQYQLGSH